MNAWSWGFIIICILTVAVLAGKVYYMKKAAREIGEGFAEKLATETNTLLSLSGHDKDMRRLADTLNVELRRLRGQRHRYCQGDLEVKEAIANISHDLRTPLTAICGYVELLRDLLERMAEYTPAAEIETGGRYLAIIENRTEVLKKLTEELFRYSIVVSTVWDDTLEDVVLNHVLEECLSVHYQMLKDNSITPVIDMPENEVKCRLNKSATLRILENIVGNAVKYSDGDLKILLSENGEIFFSNHASGLDEVSAARLFDRFYTVDTGEKSTGLGLSIARALTERMDGQITARYHEGMLDIRLVFKEMIK
ncbi:MAG: HAMP domain-containing histidine kinase [Roseburia sp.]|nr:HAMP domain-containing histidine kinase [Roseburia sp.]MCM1241299.1 HAMP domain-containing histidine kinase [Roseburia sp.]